MLSATGPAAGRADFGNFPPHQLDEGPGGGPGAKRHFGGVPALPDGRKRTHRRLGIALPGKVPAAVHRPGTAGIRQLLQLDPAAPAQVGVRGRSPLRQPMGPGLPPRLSEDPPLFGHLARLSRGGLYRHCHRPGAAGCDPAVRAAPTGDGVHRV